MEVGIDKIQNKTIHKLKKILKGHIFQKPYNYSYGSFAEFFDKAAGPGVPAHSHTDILKRDQPGKFDPYYEDDALRQKGIHVEKPGAFLGRDLRF
jgi:hypothetical protein